MKRAFSLIELLVVILIIALVIAILLPALRGARTAARSAATQAVMRDVGGACNAFALDKKRDPGVFTAAQVGHSENETRGFSAMKNIILDLSGGVVTTASATTLNVGPLAASTVTVDPSQIGSGGTGKGYFVPDRKYFDVPAGLRGTCESIVGRAGAAPMPELLDAFGQPILAWAADPRPAALLAGKSSNTAAAPATFWWTANYHALWSNALGKLQRAQTWSGTDDCSMIGWNAPVNDITSQTQSGTLEALLGNPAFPKPGTTPARPASARGTMIFHAAGPDGVYMAKNDKGTKMHGINFTRVPYTASTDAMKDYDDLLQTSSN